MGQRHNRRRTRPRSRNRAASLDSLRSSSSSIDYRQEPAASSPVHKFSEPVVLVPLAHTRHNWLEEWQSSEFNESFDAEQQQCRYFGGEPGDDENLCYYMLDYFEIIQHRRMKKDKTITTTDRREPSIVSASSGLLLLSCLSIRLVNESTIVTNQSFSDVIPYRNSANPKHLVTSVRTIRAVRLVAMKRVVLLKGRTYTWIGLL
ncbi:conserved hypothetical protein [Talaromyces stipitatus ATCC 10500]|uniref:Uncharacterized protein n=1 Tax=Talaromyces stipitatus (strain ATCC 10500 / CBS 375.48 / QM 6759 / NRRL 1006) TaxID=441959 RepID=B8M2X0_TALSN|nr:uncharacterized protein TSTA_094710 [Talaromyces stipitatus ATCC 10500]EED22225.1 conserved hypothetical protein [Talaromyces stipitatus ATCC 10500]